MELVATYRFTIDLATEIVVYYNLAICSYSLNKNVQEWLDTFLKGKWNFGHTKDEFFIDFKTESDLNWFKLRWM